MAIDDDAQDRPAEPLRQERTRPPAFNVPAVVLVLIATFAAIHAMRVLVLGPVADDRLILNFAFIPGCYGQDCVSEFGRRAGALIWSPLTHAALHGDWTHLGLNTVWLLAFGTPVARRLGPRVFLAFSAVGAIVGALAFYALNPTLIEPVIGASGVVSALMGGACRFAFRPVHHLPAGAPPAPLLSIGMSLRDRTILFFILVFFATNLLTGLGAGAFLDGGASVAWEAHLGGFAFGFFSFALFDGSSPRF